LGSQYEIVRYARMARTARPVDAEGEKRADHPSLDAADAAPQRERGGEGADVVAITRTAGGGVWPRL
jgi:hypothetical protein